MKNICPPPSERLTVVQQIFNEVYLANNSPILTSAIILYELNTTNPGTVEYAKDAAASALISYEDHEMRKE